MAPKVAKNKKLAQAIILQMVQRQYLTKLLGALKPHSYGLTFSVIIAIILGVLQAVYGFLTVPHEYGHVWAAELVGHKVQILQIDFFDQTKGISNFFRSVASDTTGYIQGAPPPPVFSDSITGSPDGNSQNAQDYSADGKLGFVVYEPSMVLANYTVFRNLSEYNSFADATELPSGEQLPIFASLDEALEVAGPNATADPRRAWAQINATHHFQVQVTPWEYILNGTVTADFSVSEWQDQSNRFGILLGLDGVTVFKALGGGAMDMLIICCMLVSAAILLGTGFSSSGALFFLLGILAVALQADYPFSSAFGGLAGDYKKAAYALSRITEWNAGTLMKFWALSWLAAPLIVFTVTFWFVRAVRIRRLRRAHVTRMLCNLHWVAACSRSKKPSKQEEPTGESDALSLGFKDCSRQSVAWTLGDAEETKVSEKHPEQIVKAALRMTRRRCGLSLPTALTQAFEDVVASYVSKPKAGDKKGSSTSSNGGSVFSINKMLLQNPEASRAIGRAISHHPRTMTKLSLQFHRTISASLAETMTRSMRRLRRHARRVVIAEVRSPPTLWIDRMTHHCDIVFRFPNATETHHDASAWVTYDASWAALQRGTKRVFRPLHHVLMAAGPHQHRRATAAWALQKWLLIARERGRLLTGPRPHWWPLLHFTAVMIALCSGLCDISDNQRQCTAATTSVIAIISAVNIPVMVLAIIWSRSRPHEPLSSCSSAAEPSTAQKAIDASDPSMENGPASLTAQDKHARMVQSAKRFLKIQSRSEAYALETDGENYASTDLPTLVQLRRDGIQDPTRLTIPTAIQADVLTEKATRKSVHMSIAARKSMGIASQAAMQGTADTSRSLSKPSVVGPMRSFTITVAPSNAPVSEQHPGSGNNSASNVKKHSKPQKAKRSHQKSNSKSHSGTSTDDTPTHDATQDDIEEHEDSRNSPRSPRKQSHKVVKGGTSKLSQSGSPRAHATPGKRKKRDRAGIEATKMVESSTTETGSSSQLMSPIRTAWHLSEIAHKLQGALVKGEGKNTDTDQSQSTQGRDSLDQQVADYKSSSCSRKPISGIQSSQSRTPPDESHKKKRPGSTSWQSPDKKGIGRNRMKDSSGSSSSKQNAKAAPVAEGLTSSDPGSPLYENEAISASERSLQVISTLDHSDQDHMCPEFLLEDPEQHHIDSGYSVASAVAEGTNYEYGGADQHQPRSQGAIAYGYAGIEPPPSSQRNVPGSRGVMWPHLASTDNAAAPPLAPQSTPVPGSNLLPNDFATDAASTSATQQPGCHQTLPPRSAVTRSNTASRNPHASSAAAAAGVLPSVSLTGSEAPSTSFSRSSHTAMKPTQSLMRPSLTRTASSSAHRISGPQYIPMYHEGTDGHSEIQKLAAPPAGPSTFGASSAHASASGFFERTTSYGSESLHLNKRSMRWTAVSETFASESAGADTASIPRGQSSQAKLNVRDSSSVKGINTDSLRFGRQSSAAASQGRDSKDKRSSIGTSAGPSVVFSSGNATKVQIPTNVAPQKRVAFGVDDQDSSKEKQTGKKRASAAITVPMISAAATGKRSRTRHQPVSATGKPCSDMSVICGWAARLEGAYPEALQIATKQAKRVHWLWLASHAVSACACFTLTFLGGWRQLQVCLFLLLWTGACCSFLEYAMSWIVHETMDMHLEAGHSPGWERRHRRAKQLFILSQRDKEASSSQQGSSPVPPLSEAEADELRALNQERTSLTKWYQSMRVAGCIGLLRPQQLSYIGALETVLQEPDAVGILPAAPQASKLDSQYHVDNSLGSIDVCDATPAADSNPSEHEFETASNKVGASGQTSISINVPMDDVIRERLSMDSGTEVGARTAHGPHAVSDPGALKDQNPDDDHMGNDVDALDGWHSDSSSGSDSGSEHGTRAKSKSIFQRIAAAGARSGGLNSPVGGALDPDDNIDEEMDQYLSAETHEYIEEDAMDSLMTAVEDAQSGILDHTLSPSMRNTGRLRNAAKSVLGFLADDVRSARQTVVSVAGGLGGIAQGVGRAANTGRKSIAAGIVGNSAALADIQEQDHQQSEQRKPAQKSTTSERRKSRRPASSRQNKRSKTQHENDGEQEQAMPKEEIVLQPDSPV